LAGIGAFPSIKSPRVIWIGTDKGDEEVKTIAKALEDKLSALGIAQEDRAFSSHITLGRIRSSKNRNNLAQSLESLKEKPLEGIIELRVEKITLYKSTLTPRGPIYEVIKETYLLKSK
jgi:2'-5' RNA ligase